MTVHKGEPCVSKDTLGLQANIYPPQRLEAQEEGELRTQLTYLECRSPMVLPGLLTYPVKLRLHRTVWQGQSNWIFPHIPLIEGVHEI